ncbi:MAG: sensor histidine kinase [Peptostreptococcaceae bacterium]
MDTKSKSNKIAIYIIGIISILIASIGMCLVYPKIEKDSEKFKYNIYEERTDILEEISEFNYSLYYQMYNEDSSEKKRPSDILLNLDILSEYQNNGEYEDYKNQFDSEVYNWYSRLSSSAQNLEYYALNKKSEEVKKRTNLSIDSNQNISTNIADSYSFYLELDYDENGNMTVGQVYGANKSEISSKLEQLQRESVKEDFYYIDGLEMNEIKNMKFIYAVPKELVYNDNIYYANRYMEADAFSQASYLFINIAMVFIVTIGSFIPYRELKNLRLFKKIINIPIEIIIIAICVAIGFIYGSPEILIMSSIRRELVQITQLQLSKDMMDVLVYSINTIYWIICFSIILIGVNVIKHIFKSNFKEYIKSKSLIYKLFSFIGKKIKNFFNWCTNIDLKDKNNKKITLVLGINLIIVALMCSIWMFGIIVAFIYTFVLFILVKKKYLKVNEDYNKLLKTTNEIAKGNLDINTEDDLGVFNSLKDEISNIQVGFKKAVEEEVKSQKMKTELISNVSHDLKTPLTSIITYVDLLKDENLNEEKRRQYLDTLDKKSQRLQDLIEDLFEVSKVSSGNVNLNIVDIDVVSLMKQTLLELDDKIKESNLIIRSNMPKDKVILSLDSQRTFRVFENLIINITKYAMPNSRVYIDIIETDNEVEISLKNMAAEEINFSAEEIAERFVRGDKSRNTKGSGLGLAIAKSFVELQSGKFEIIIDGDLFKVLIIFQK